MTPEQVKQTRLALGFSQRELAQALNMAAGGGRTVWAWENGKYPVPGPVAVALELMLEQKIVEAGKTI